MILNRRKFLASSMLGTGALLSTTLFSFRALSSRPESNLDQYLELIHAKKCPDALERDPDLRTEYQKHASALANSGYLASQPLFREGICIVPFKLCTTELGMLDVVLLFFERDENQIWQKSATLTGFQLEALVKSADNWNREALPDLFTPVLSDSGAPAGTVTCRSAKFHIKTSIKPESTETELEVTTGNDPTFRKRIASGHPFKSGRIVS